jgi:hypothetical protein
LQRIDKQTTTKHYGCTLKKHSIRYYRWSATDILCEELFLFYTVKLFFIKN